jgi:ferredoxin
VPGSGGAATLTVLAHLCTGCGECVEICPVDAVYFVEELIA